MNNAALKAILTEYGKKVKAIHCTNFSVQLNQSFVGIKPVTNDEIEYKTFGGEDFFAVPMYDSHNKRYYHILVKTDTVETVHYTEKESDTLDMYFV